MWLFIATNITLHNLFLIKPNNQYPIKMEENICPLPGVGKNRPFSLLPPCHTWKGCKSSPCGDACNQKASYVCCCCFWCWLIATTLADKHMATVLPNCVMVRRLQKKLESLVTYMTCITLYALSPQTDPIQLQHEFPHKPALNIFRSRCQQMSTPHHVLLKATVHCTAVIWWSGASGVTSPFLQRP